MMKKVISLIIVLVMIATTFVSGCSRKQQRYNTETSNLPQETAVESEDKEDVETEEESTEEGEAENSPETVMPETSSSETTAPVTSTPTVTKPADIEYSIEALAQAIQACENYRNYGVCCEFSNEIVYGEAWEYMTHEQQEVACDLRPCGCCCTISQASSHVGKYMASNMNHGVDPFVLVEYRGILYCLIGTVVATEFDTNIANAQVTRTAYNKVSVTTGQYDMLDKYFLCNTRFDFEYIDGAYKITGVTELN